MFINEKGTAENTYDAIVIGSGICMCWATKEICEKALRLSGYFSSEIGMTQARNYIPLPRKFEVCISYQQGDKPWAT